MHGTLQAIRISIHYIPHYTSATNYHNRFCLELLMCPDSCRYTVSEVLSVVT